MQDTNIFRLIFGIKIKYLRQQKGWSFQELADKTGLSLAYLHDIETGKKYPKADKISTLGKALDVSYDYLVSLHGDKKLQPIVELLESDFLKTYPLERFGVQPQALLELLVNAPDRVAAIINTIVTIARSYQLSKESFNNAALRSFQDLHDNYFGKIEAAAQEFRARFALPAEPPVTKELLENLLKSEFGIAVDRQTLSRKRLPDWLRSFYSEGKKTLFINQGFNAGQENFLLGRELGFQFLGYKERPFETIVQKTDSFDKLLNNFLASYFSTALLMDENILRADIQRIANEPAWREDLLTGLLTRYDVTPEMLFQRLTNILPQHFGIRDIFFIRVYGSADLKTFRITKELHLSQLHNPYASALNEHYCRRWVSVNILKRLRAMGRPASIPLEGSGVATLEGPGVVVADAQISQYWQTPNQYLCLSLAKPDTVHPKEGVSVTIGLLMNEKLRSQFRFTGDPGIPVRVVNNTCERCSLPDCSERVAAPVFVEREKEVAEVWEVLKGLE